MAARDELRTWVETLSEEEAAAALRAVRRLRDGDGSSARARLADRMGPSALSGAAFLSTASPDLAMLAAAQGVRPVAQFEDLLTNLWPDDEDPDAFAATLRQWRESDR